MKRTTLLILLAVFVGALAWVGYRYYGGIKPAVTKPPYDIAEVIEDATSSAGESDETSEPVELPPAENMTEFPLTMPDGFSIEIFAKDLAGARAMAFDAFGGLYVSQTSEGKISRILVDKDGKSSRSLVLFSGLRKPHGIALDPQDQYRVYIAEENRISSFYDAPGPGVLEKIVDLPTGGRHFTRSIGFGRDGQMYVSIGSTCDVCVEKDDWVATIMRVNLETGELEPYAKGLRNSVFFTFHPETDEIWATEMGREHLGDDLPPDEINIIEEGPSASLRVKHYGWPNCYGKNIHDTDFDKNVYVRNPCMEPFETPSFIDLPAHVAPLGLAFIPKNSKWPKEYWGDLLVAYHRSWNSSVPVGYKVVRFEFDENNNAVAEHDFISGWLTSDNRALGRPVDILVEPDGTAFISDDKAGVVYRVSYVGANP